MSYQNPLMAPQVPLLAASLFALLACDKIGPLADLDAAPAPASTTSITASAVGAPSAATAQAAQAATHDLGRAMPPLPVPTSSPTVTIGMPQEVQLQAISYMQAMQAPRPNDASADPAYAKQIADSLRSLGKIDVLSSGRRLEVKLVRGCDATFPKSATGRSSAGSLSVLLANGVLVMGCVDRSVECWQSTRDQDDVLCVHK